GSMSVAPVMTRKEADDTSTDRMTVTRPSARMARLLCPPRNGGRCWPVPGGAVASCDGSLVGRDLCINGPPCAVRGQVWPTGHEASSQLLPKCDTSLADTTRLLRQCGRSAP